VLAHAELLTARQEGAAPILLLDEIPPISTSIAAIGP